MEKTTKVPAVSQLPMSALHLGGVATKGGAANIPTSTLKRKTPSELRENVPRKCDAQYQVQNSRPDDAVDSEAGDQYPSQTNNPTEMCAKSTFKSVQELSLGGEKLDGFSSVDMGKALKGLVSCGPHIASNLLAKSGNVVEQNFPSELHIPGDRVPLDLTLKSSMILVSSSSVRWFHRLMNCSPLNDSGSFSHIDRQSESMTCAYPWALHSWVYPQSTISPEAISASTHSPGQMEYLHNRQRTWEDSFRSLYYTLRKKKTCKIFYVCSMQFVAMFIASDGLNNRKNSCYAYVSQSTQNLRSLLKEQDVSFSMPLCCSKEEEFGLSPSEMYNLGQDRATEYMTGIDNTPQSLLMFSGNNNVHALYDFLLNYRSFFNYLTGGDVPVLYSPVSFANASQTAPEVICKEVSRADYMIPRPAGSSMVGEPMSRPGSGICYSVEIKGPYIPPWIICGVCHAMRANGGYFQTRFVTNPAAVGLNVGLHIARGASEADKPLEERDNYFGIPGTALSLEGHSAILRGLKYHKESSSYMALLSPIK